MRTRRATLAAGAALLAAAMSWSLWPAAPIELRAPSFHPRPTPTAQADAPAAVDPRVFAIDLWHSPPAPAAPAPVAQAAPEPPKPLNVQLIGIINDNGVRRAALYDIETDRLLILSNGEGLRGNIINSISEQSVELTDGRITRQLTLVQTPSPIARAGGGRS